MSDGPGNSQYHDDRSSSNDMLPSDTLPDASMASRTSKYMDPADFCQMVPQASAYGEHGFTSSTGFSQGLASTQQQQSGAYRQPPHPTSVGDVSAHHVPIPNYQSSASSAGWSTNGIPNSSWTSNVHHPESRLQLAPSQNSRIGHTVHGRLLGPPTQMSFAPLSHGRVDMLASHAERVGHSNNSHFNAVKPQQIVMESNIGTSHDFEQDQELPLRHLDEYMQHTYRPVSSVYPAHQASYDLSTLQLPEATHPTTTHNSLPLGSTCNRHQEPKPRSKGSRSKRSYTEKERGRVAYKRKYGLVCDECRAKKIKCECNMRSELEPPAPSSDAHDNPTSPSIGGTLLQSSPAHSYAASLPPNDYRSGDPKHLTTSGFVSQDELPWDTADPLVVPNTQETSLESVGRRFSVHSPRYDYPNIVVEDTISQEATYKESSQRYKL